MSQEAAQDRCPKCSRLVTSIYQSGNKKFYNHGEGGSVDWKSGQAFDLRFDDYCSVEVKQYLKSNTRKDGKEVYADAETERKLESVGFIKATGSPYYSYKGLATGPEIVVYDDGTWNVLTGFLSSELQRLNNFAGMTLTAFADWMNKNYDEMTRATNEAPE
jgi:hypothetical protein